MVNTRQTHWAHFWGSSDGSCNTARVVWQTKGSTGSGKNVSQSGSISEVHLDSCRSSRWSSHRLLSSVGLCKQQEGVPLSAGLLSSWTSTPHSGPQHSVCALVLGQTQRQSTLYFVSFPGLFLYLVIWPICQANFSVNPAKPGQRFGFSCYMCCLLILGIPPHSGIY